MDDSGTIYVADTGNHTIRKIDAAGNVTTVLGSAGQNGFSISSSPGALFQPVVLGFDSARSLYFINNNGVIKYDITPQ